MEDIKFTPANYKSDQAVRWCPGCGDHAILNTLHKAMASIGVPPHKMAVISGIGCSSRLPYYMNTYGFHTIHAVRRNIDINILLFNNKIYGLTKGQYSPTSDRGFVSKSSPYGTTEDPFIPAELVFGARGNFFARSIDVELQVNQEVLTAAQQHKGTSVVEMLCNCVIWNHGIHDFITDRENRAERTIHLVHGEKMLFGKEKNKGLVRDGFLLKAVEIGKDGYTIDDVLVHDAHTKSNFLHQQLAMMDGHELPLAIGIIRDVEGLTYNDEIDKQVETVRAKKGFATLRDMVLAGETWTVE